MFDITIAHNKLNPTLSFSCSAVSFDKWDSN